MLAESYRVLQVPFGTDMPQVRHAYRRLVLQYHPDRNREAGAQEMFLRVQAAYEYLQRFHNVVPVTAYATAGAASASQPKPQPVSDWDRYQYVYDPPADPKEYNAWAAVARERARKQKEKDHAAYIRATLAMKKKWWYPVARYGSYGVLLFGVLVGASFISIPIFFLLNGYFKPSLMGIITVPMGLKIVQVMLAFRVDIRKHFGEDLPETVS
ncbi:hypothetical protein TH63_14780 [Rufibacter radiotolerans]|uniref:J domain-containing protein n=1 Tax=Rufibacter radiotolerans TaxID=1379910 RepID=A0A0H4VMR6_9BACT|nr:J domain-containing protein [Rufibacter radiotolerans]AKQ46608.1 hypothetical protein TH63_14780 [Rufibacter radiotolerans]